MLFLCGVLSSLRTYINKLENVERFALRVCTKQWSLSYADLIGKCNLVDFMTRRSHLSFSLLHKIINGDCIFPNAPIASYSTNYFTRSQAANVLVLPHACTNLFQNSFFFPHTISSWNSLPAHINATSSIVAFKSQLLHYCTYMIHN